MTRINLDELERVARKSKDCKSGHPLKFAETQIDFAGAFTPDTCLRLVRAVKFAKANMFDGDFGSMKEILEATDGD